MLKAADNAYYLLLLLDLLCKKWAQPNKWMLHVSLQTPLLFDASLKSSKVQETLLFGRAGLSTAHKPGANLMTLLPLMLKIGSFLSPRHRSLEHVPQHHPRVVSQGSRTKRQWQQHLRRPRAHRDRAGRCWRLYFRLTQHCRWQDSRLNRLRDIAPPAASTRLCIA
jgi:hypothetical protein